MQILSFAKIIGKNICKYIPGMLAEHQKLLDLVKQFATDNSKTTSKKVIEKMTEATSDLLGNKIRYTAWSENLATRAQSYNNKITSNAQTASQIEEKSKEIAKERYMSPEKKKTNYYCAEINTII